jgi:radical SAM protein with 4Fe4S-binding SPASM domain
MRFVWYSPTPMCLFNPAAHGLGGKSCAAADGLLSVAPNGDVLPCSSFEQGIGNLLREDFDVIWNRRAAGTGARRNSCAWVSGVRNMLNLCCGACPLYWDEQGGFKELAVHQRIVRSPRFVGALGAVMRDACRVWG